jgi:hypothetical protein
MNFLGDGTVNGKLTDKLLPKMIFSAVAKAFYVWPVLNDNSIHDPSAPSAPRLNFIQLVCLSSRA